MKRDVGPRPRRRPIVHVGFSGDLKNDGRDGVRHSWLGKKQFGAGPNLTGHDVSAAVVVDGLHVDKGVKDEQRVQEMLRGELGNFGVPAAVLEQINEDGDVVFALHGPEKLDGARPRDEGIGFGAGGQSGQVGGLDVRRLVNARRDAVQKQINKPFTVAAADLELVDELSGLCGVERLGGSRLMTSHSEMRCWVKKGVLFGYAARFYFHSRFEFKPTIQNYKFSYFAVGKVRQRPSWR